tara:strand:+ start:6321 stop:6485 length:165 start_codon:yes stop_codon:yes gene_type:complete
MINNNKKRLKILKNLQEAFYIDECHASKASSELMLNRICINDQKEFPFSNFLGS